MKIQVGDYILFTTHSIDWRHEGWTNCPFTIQGQVRQIYLEYEEGKSELWNWDNHQEPKCIDVDGIRRAIKDDDFAVQDCAFSCLNDNFIVIENLIDVSATPFDGVPFDPPEIPTKPYRLAY